MASDESPCNFMSRFINECLQVANGLSEPNKENTDDDNDGNVNKICFNSSQKKWKKKIKRVK